MTASAVTYPSNFFDVTSPKLLKQPEPQYFWAMLLAAAEAKSTLQNVPGIGLPGRQAASGGLAYASELDRLQLAAASECSEAISVEESLGRGPGHTIRINRPAFSGGGYTEAYRQIGPSESISVTPIDVSGEQTTITLKRVIGPFASGGSVPQPYAIDSMDAQLGVHKLSDIVALHLRRDRMVYIDTVLNSYFNEASVLVFVNPSFTADNDYTSDQAGQLNAETLFRVEESLATRHIPSFSNGRWKMALHSRALRQLKTDSVYAAYAKDHTEKNPLFPGYVATIGRLDLYEVNTVGSASNSSSVTVYKNVAFGPGMVGYGVGKRPTVQPSTDDNYGETGKVIWCAYEGITCLDDRFAVSCRTT